jgi:hypothetical protein
VIAEGGGWNGCAHGIRFIERRRMLSQSMIYIMKNETSRMGFSKNFGCGFAD